MLCAMQSRQRRTNNVDMREINQGVISEFRANDGKLTGPMEGAPILLLTTTGAQQRQHAHDSGRVHRRGRSPCGRGSERGL